MLDLKYLFAHRELVAAQLLARKQSIDLSELFALDAQRKSVQHSGDALRNQQNQASQVIAERKRTKEDASDLLAAMKNIAAQIKQSELDCAQIEFQLTQLALGLPNLLDDSVPRGATADDNRLMRTHGTPRTFDFPIRDHVDLGDSLGLLDFERAGKMSGARFVIYRGAGARLERALINFMLDLQTREHGYTEFQPPLLVNAAAMTGTGQLPKFEEDLFKTTNGWYLIPTAEVPLTNMHAGEILSADQLPMRAAAYTPCFRSEAGSYGKDTRGLIRQHQFNKVELVSLAHPDHSFEELERMTGCAETILQRLELPYRVVQLCSGDIGFSAAKTYDLEVWLPGQNAYREISSCSNCTDFQARRANIRFRDAEKKVRFVHTLNGSGLAVGRTLVAILENYQQADGSITIPAALQPYFDHTAQIAP